MSSHLKLLTAGKNPAPVRPDATAAKRKTWLDALREMPAPTPEPTIGPATPRMADPSLAQSLFNPVQWGKDATVPFNRMVRAVADADPADFAVNAGLTAMSAPMMPGGAGKKAAGALARAFGAKELAKMPKWALLTAENVGGRQMAPDANEAAMKWWLSLLKKLKLPTDIPTTGQYPSGAGQLIKGENSLILPVGENTGRALARGVGQESLLVPRGYLGIDGTLNPSAGLREVTPDDLAWFELQSGERRTSMIDWDRALKPKPLLLDHYSPRDLLPNADPAFQGTGRAGAERFRPNRPKMTHFYERGARPEPYFTGDHLYHAETNVPILDVNKDRDGMIPRIMASLRRGVDHGDHFERMLETIGFGGYRDGPIIKLFDKLPLTQIRSILATALGAGAAQQAMGERK